jgi:hypothetical protein
MHITLPCICIFDLTGFYRGRGDLDFLERSGFLANERDFTYLLKRILRVILIGFL